MYITKRILLTAFSFIIMLSICSCGTTSTLSGEDKWQEQYDLGVRYLSEGNYEEAIIAFTAAIEIDPKRTEAYMGAADAYLKSGQNMKAKEILEQGIELTNDESLEDKLNEISLNEYGATIFENRDRYFEFDKLVAEGQGYIAEIVAALESGNKQELITLTGAVKERIPEDCLGMLVMEHDNVVQFNLYSTYNGYKIRIRSSLTETEAGYDKWMEAEIREENGNGYLASVSLATDLSNFALSEGAERAEYYEYYSGTCVNWQWDGEVTGVDQRMVWYRDRDDTCSDHVIIGSLDCGLRVGITTENGILYEYTSGKFVESILSETITTYESGVQTSKESRSYMPGYDKDWKTSIIDIKRNDNVVYSVNYGSGSDISNIRGRDRVWW